MIKSCLFIPSLSTGGGEKTGLWEEEETFFWPWRKKKGEKEVRLASTCLRG